MSDTPLRDKVPPHSPEAETATLGAIMLDTDSLGRVLSFLKADDFYRSANGTIYRTVLDLWERAEPIDLITVTDALKGENNLDRVGGASYVSSLTSAVPTSANIEYYARIVSETSMRRRILKAASEIIADAYTDGLPAREIVEEAERRIFEITEGQHTGGFKQAREIVKQTVEAIEKLYRTRDDYTGIPSGFPALDKMLSGFQNSEFVVIGARPSVGKTALALTMAANISVQRQIPTGFFSLEMSDMAIMQRLIASEARISSQKIRTGMLRPADFKNIADAAGAIYEAPLLISDTPGMRLLELRAQARRMKSQFDVRIIFVDYISLINNDHADLPRHEQIAEISRSLKALARELEIPVVALSQVTRDVEGKRPTLSSIRESGSIEQDADVVIFLHRNRGESAEDPDHANNVETELIVAKQRNGPVGTVRIAFVPKYTRFESLEHEGR